MLDRAKNPKVGLWSGNKGPSDLNKFSQLQLIVFCKIISSPVAILKNPILPQAWLFWHFYVNAGPYKKFESGIMIWPGNNGQSDVHKFSQLQLTGFCKRNFSHVAVLKNPILPQAWLFWHFYVNAWPYKKKPKVGLWSGNKGQSD